MEDGRDMQGGLRGRGLRRVLGATCSLLAVLSLLYLVALQYLAAAEWDAWAALMLLPPLMLSLCGRRLRDVNRPVGLAPPMLAVGAVAIAVTGVVRAERVEGARRSAWFLTIDLEDLEAAQERHRQATGVYAASVEHLGADSLDLWSHGRITVEHADSVGWSATGSTALSPTICVIEVSRSGSGPRESRMGCRPRTRRD